MVLFDEILKEIGEFGAYQKRVYLLAAAPAILVAFETLSVIFIFFIPDHRCKIPGYDLDTFIIQDANHSLLVNQSISMTNGRFDSCHVIDNGIFNVSVTRNESSYGDTYAVNTSELTECDSWVYDHSTFESTIPTDFDVVCGRSLVRANSNMISEIGTLLGTLFIGIIADRFGRKVPFYLGGLALVGGGFGIAFTTNLTTLNLCRFILGVARMAVFVNGIVIGMEVVGPSKRSWAGLVIEFLWCAGEFLLVLIAFFIRNWRYLEIAVSIPSVGLLFYWWIIPESPRWLSSRGRHDEALAILERIAASNKTKVPTVDDASKLMTNDKDKLSFREALKSRELLLRVFIVLSNMFVIVVVYYGLTLNITNLSGDVFINFTISVVMESLGYAVTLMLLDRLGRKPLFSGSMILSGLACCLSLVPVVAGLPAWTLVALSMLGRFAVCIAFGTIYVYGAELYPTVVRASAMGVGVTFSRFGSILSPYIADVGLLLQGKYRDVLPLIVMGSPALVVGLLSLWLPETLHTSLPDTLEDMERSKMNRGCLCCERNHTEDIELKSDKDEAAMSI